MLSLCELIFYLQSIKLTAMLLSNKSIKCLIMQSGFFSFCMHVSAKALKKFSDNLYFFRHLNLNKQLQYQTWYIKLFCIMRYMYVKCNTKIGTHTRKKHKNCLFVSSTPCTSVSLIFTLCVYYNQPNIHDYVLMQC